MDLAVVLALVLVLTTNCNTGSTATSVEQATTNTGTVQPEQLLSLLSESSSSSSSRSSSSSSSHLQRLRRLQQQKQQQQQPAATGTPIDVPQCIWNEVREVCTSSQLSYLSVSSPPVTVFHRTAVMAYDRNLVCNGHPDAARCNKGRQNRCMYWNKSCVGMDAFELVNWVGDDILDGEATALAFTCKGTDAATLKQCATATEAGPAGICNQLPGCQFEKQLQICVPKAWSAQNYLKLNTTRKGYDEFSPQVWGSCAGACYVRQASSCLKLAGNATACTRKPYCVWERDAIGARQVCMHRDTAARAADAYSQELAKIRDTCHSQRSQDSCEQFRVIPRSRGVIGNTNLAKLITEAAAACPL